MHLSFHDHGVDNVATVINRHEAANFHFPVPVSISTTQI